MQEQGIEDTTIEQICRRADVSVGSFYNYYKSKDDVIVSAFKSADQYFEEVVTKEVDGLGFEDQISTFFLHYAKYNVQQGLHFVKNLYNNSDQKLFVSSKRYMHSFLLDIIKGGQESGKLSNEISPEELEHFLFIVARGVVNDWCLYDGEYDLENKLTSYIKSIIRIYLR
jgi:AcrR family transcriptional regulator